VCRTSLRNITRIALCTILVVLFLAACATPTPSSEAQQVKPSPTSPPAPTGETEPAPTISSSTEEATEEPTAVPTEAPTGAPPTEPPSEPAAAPLPPERQAVSFEAADGQALDGYYYAADANPAPLIVLMHWAPGDASHWEEIAYWLQNRGLSGASGGSDPWSDPSWFPALRDGRSYAVFTFTFRQCGGGDGCQSFEPEGWLDDATAAMATARELDGVDPDRVIAIGASIGSDGAVDACGDGCLGALALSPGSYLGVPFAEAASILDRGDPPRPVWCLAAEGDGESAPTCEGASGSLYRAIIYPGNDHGMMLIRPESEPDVLGLVLEFLEQTLNS
jgi:dienelactone hydrolase